MSGLPGATMAWGQTASSIAPYIAPAFPEELVSAKKADRIAWLAYDHGQRNVYAAAAPEFRPVRLTAFLDDNGIVLSDLSISDDGSTVVFLRGGEPNTRGWIADPSSDPGGCGTRGLGGTNGRQRRVAARSAARRRRFRPMRAPWRSPATATSTRTGSRPTRGARTPGDSIDRGLKALIRVWGRNMAPVWSPDGPRLAFVSIARQPFVHRRVRRAQAAGAVHGARAWTGTQSRRGRTMENASPSSGVPARRSASRRSQATEASATPTAPARTAARRTRRTAAGRRGRRHRARRWPVPRGVPRRVHAVVHGRRPGDGKGRRSVAQPAGRLEVLQHPRDRVRRRQPHLPERTGRMDPLVLGERERRHDDADRADAGRGRRGVGRSLARRDDAVLRDECRRYRPAAHLEGADGGGTGDADHVGQRHRDVSGARSRRGGRSPCSRPARRGRCRWASFRTERRNAEARLSSSLKGVPRHDAGRTRAGPAQGGRRAGVPQPALPSRRI